MVKLCVKVEENYMYAFMKMIWKDCLQEPILQKKFTLKSLI